MKYNLLKVIVLGGLLATLQLSVQAQYNQYSQFHYSPLLTNPALTATSNNLQVLLNYRQESLANGFVYTNPMVSVIHPFVNNNGDGSERWGGVGFGLMQDQTRLDNVSGIRTVAFSLNYAHNLKITKNSFLAFGVQGSYFNKSINTNNLMSREDILASGNNDPLLAAAQIKDLGSFSAGTIWYQEGKQGMKNYFGFSVYHINRPNVNFNKDIEKLAMPVQWVFTAGYEVFNNDKFSVQPNARVIFRDGNKITSRT